jgi:outer membrane protein TolC
MRAVHPAARRPHPDRLSARAVSALLLLSTLAFMLSLVCGDAQARCIDEEAVEGTDGVSVAALGNRPGRDAASPSDPRGMLAGLVAEALVRSQALGAARLLAEAALQDVEEVRSTRRIQASAGGGVGPSVAQSGTVIETSAVQVRASLNASQLLYDGGRTDRLVEWRSQIAEAARYGHLSQQEQVAVSTVSLALERSRFRMQVQVYSQYARKMSCLVEALETIVKADRGRASELVQARKSQQQAELSMVQAQSQARQVEVQLRRFVGDGLPSIEGLGSVLLTVAPLEALQADVERSADLAQYQAQALAAQRYAAATEASTKPQVSWVIGGSKSVGAGGNIPASSNRAGSLQVGLQLSVPLMNPGVAYASEAARLRASAAQLQRVDALEARRFRVAEIFEQTQSAFERARRVGTVLRDSDEVRNFTLQQWQQLGRRSLFDVMGAEGDHYGLRVAYVNALHDGQQLNALLLSLGRGVTEWLR